MFLPLTTENKILNGAVWTLIERVCFTFLQFATIIVLSRFLKPEDFGLYGMVYIFIAICQIIVDSSMGSFLIKKSDTSELDYSTLFIFNLAISILLYAILYITSNNISVFFDNPEVSRIIKVTSCTLIISSFNIVQSIQLMKFLKFRTISFITIISYSISSSVSIIIAYLGYGVWSLVSLNIIQTLLNTLGFIIANRYKPSMRFSFKSFKEQFLFGVYLTFSNILKAIYQNIYTSMIGKMHDIKMAGYYTQADKIQSAFVLVTTAIIDRAVFPVLSQIVDIKEQKRISIMLLRNASMFIFPCMLLISLLCKPLIVVLIGPKWIPASSILSVLSFAGIFVFLQSICRNTLKSFAQTRQILYIELFQVIISLIIISLTIKNIKILTIGVVLSSFISLVLYMRYISNLINYTIINQLSTISVFLISALIPYIILKLSYTYIGNLPSFVIIVLNCVLFILMYILILKILKVSELKIYKNLIFNHIKLFNLNKK